MAHERVSAAEVTCSCSARCGYCARGRVPGDTMEAEGEKQETAQGAPSGARRGKPSRRASRSSLGAGVMRGARTAAPVFKRTFGRVGDWLANIGWGKFFLLAILLLVFGGIAG